MSVMETWEAITSRRNVRSFADRPIPAADLARRLLGFPQDRGWAFLISLGYPADRPLTPIKNPRRRAFGEVVHRDRW
jgi:nitroreductase